MNTISKYHVTTLHGRGEKNNFSDTSLEQREEEPTTRDKWLTVDAWKKKIIYIRYDFDSDINFGISDFNRALNNVGTIRQKVSTGNNAGREYCYTDCEGISFLSVTVTVRYTKRKMVGYLFVGIIHCEHLHSISQVIISNRI
jgi:hypothetical protein